MSSIIARGGTWIISRRQDLLWFHGSVLASLALGALFAFGPHGAEFALLCLWGVLFDGTHDFGTYARSYLAPDTASRDGLPGPASWLWLGVGPLAALAEHTIVPGIFSLFLLGAYLWAYWHLVRQHWGFVALYQRGAPTRLGWLLWLGCVYPLARFSLSETYLQSGMPRLVPVAALGPVRLAVDLLALAMMITIIIVRARDRRPLRLRPAHLYVTIDIGLHWAAFAFLHSLLPIVATLNLFHNLTYHRIVWHHQARRGRKPAGSLGRYLALGILLGVVWYLPRLFAAAAAPSLGRDLILGAGWGVAFHHYLIDGKIWRLRRPALREALA